MLIHCAVVLSHVVAVAAPPAAAAPGTATAAATNPAEAARSEQAKQLYAEQRHVESARAYEELYAEFKAAKYLFNAAAAREAAGQDAHAYVLLRRYLDTPGLSPDQHERGEARMGPLQRRTSPIRLEIAPSPFPAGIELALTRADAEALVLGEETLQALDGRGFVEIWAEAGDWSVRARAPGFQQVESPARSLEGTAPSVALTLLADPVVVAEAPRPAATGSLTVSTGDRRLPAALLLRLRRDDQVVEKEVRESESTWDLPVGAWTLTAESPDFFAGPHAVQVVGGEPQHVWLPLQRTRQSRLKLGITGSVAGALGLVGIGFAIRGAMVFPRAPPSCDAMAPTCPPGPYFADLRAAAISRYVAGAALGLSLGLGAGAVLMHRGERRRMTRVGLGVGFSLLVVGAVATGLLTRSFADDALDDTRRRGDLERLQHGTAAAVGLSGFGLGLVTSSLVFANFGKRGPRR